MNKIFLTLLFLIGVNCFSQLTSSFSLNYDFMKIDNHKLSIDFTINKFIVGVSYEGFYRKNVTYYSFGVPFGYKLLSGCDIDNYIHIEPKISKNFNIGMNIGIRHYVHTSNRIGVFINEAYCRDWLKNYIELRLGLFYKL